MHSIFSGPRRHRSIPYETTRARQPSSYLHHNEAATNADSFSNLQFESLLCELSYLRQITQFYSSMHKRLLEFATVARGKYSIESVCLLNDRRRSLRARPMQKLSLYNAYSLWPWETERGGLNDVDHCDLTLRRSRSGGEDQI